MRITILACLLAATLGLSCFAQTPEASTPIALLVVGPTEFDDGEFQLPQDTLLDAGWNVVVGARSGPVAVSVQGVELPVDVHLADVDGSDYAALLFVGGKGAATYCLDEEAHRVMREVADSGGTLAGICAGVMVLVYGGFLDGQTAAIAPYQLTDEQLAEYNVVRAKRPIWIERSRDDSHLLVTATWPSYGAKLANAMLDAVGSSSAE